MKALEFVFDEAKGVRLNAYLQDTSPEYRGITKRPAVVVLPGGGYSMCSDREADCIALGYLNAGFHAFVLRYTLFQHGKWPAPLCDFDHAMEFIAEHAEEWTVDVDRIAVCGFSAGGHLAASCATMAVHRPAAAILGYPVIRQDITNACAPGMPSPLDHVDENTSPCFIFSARDDECVPVNSSIEFQQALYNHGVAFEAHIYSFGNHGFCTGRAPLINPAAVTPRAGRWIEDSVEWLGELWGKLTANGCDKPAITRLVNRDHEARLSLSSTFGYVESIPAAADIVAELRALLPKCSEDIRATLPWRTIREILYAAGYRLGETRQFHDRLQKVVK